MKNEMSSLQSASKRRCVVQKLDFENCIVTNIRTKSRGRKKLRARITREFEQIDDSQGELNSPLTIRPTPPEPSTEGDKSPVFFKKKKRNVEKENKNAGEDSSPISPVFKLKMSKLRKSEEKQKAMRRMISVDLFSQGSSNGQSYQIEDFTTQESKQSAKISWVSSEEFGNKSSDYSLECKSDSSKGLNISWDRDALSHPLSKWLEAKELSESLEPVRKSYKRNSLLGKLEKLLQKQASEKLLWQHQNRGNSSCSLRFVVVDFWKEESNFMLKCGSLEAGRDVTFVVVDSKWVPNVRNIQRGCVIQLCPLWQKLSISKPLMSVLLNVICLDILEEIRETSRKSVDRESVPVDEFESDPSLFVNSLFLNSFSKLLI